MRVTKRGLYWILALAIALLFGSCYWNPQSGAGKITLNLKSTTRSTVDPTVVQYARAYLYADNMNSRITIGDGVPFAEAAMSPSGGSMTIDHVPAGSGYQLVLTLGSKPDGSTFVPGTFGTSQSFDVTAGHQTDVAIASLADVGNLLGSSVEYDLLGKNLTGVTQINDGSGNRYLGATDAHNLYYGTGIGALSAKTLPSGRSVNSISSYLDGQLNAHFMVSTNGGILPYDASAGTLQPTLFPFNLATAPTGAVFGAGYYSTNGGTYYARTTSGLTGNTGGGGSWVSTNLSSSDSGQQVFDFALDTNTGNAFFATQVGAFGIDTSLATGSNKNLDFIDSKARFFSVARNGRNLFISSVATDSSNVYAGTSDGIYYDTTTAVLAGPPFSWQQAPESSGHPFVKLIAGYEFIALSNQLILMYNSVNAPPYVIPIPAITLGELRAIWIGDDYTLYVAGSEGLTAVTFPN